MSLLSKITKGQIGRAQRTVIYGPEGFGKSTLASQFPDPLFADVEESTSQLDVSRLSRADLPNLKTFETLCGEVAKTRPCSTLVVDTIDWLEEMAAAELLEEWKCKNLEQIDGGYGKGYNYLTGRVTLTLAKLDAVIAAGIHVVLLAHASIVRFDPPDGAGAFDRYELKLYKDRKGGKGTASLIKEWADMLLFGNWRTQVAEKGKGDQTKFKGVGGRERQMNCNRSAAWDAKNRHDMADVEKWDIAVIEAAFRKVGAPWKVLGAGPAAPATTGQGKAESDAAPAQQKETVVKADPTPSASTAPAEPPPKPIEKSDEIPMKHDATGQPVSEKPAAIVSSTANGDLPQPPIGESTMPKAFVTVCSSNEERVNLWLRTVRKCIKPNETWRNCDESLQKRIATNPATFLTQVMAQTGGAK